MIVAKIYCPIHVSKNSRLEEAISMAGSGKGSVLVKLVVR